MYTVLLGMLTKFTYTCTLTVFAHFDEVPTLLKIIIHFWLSGKKKTESFTLTLSDSICGCLQICR